MSLSEKDSEFLDEYTKRTGSGSKSAVVRRALNLLRAEEMEGAYAAAWREWAGSEDAALWEGVSQDGLADASR